MIISKLVYAQKSHSSQAFKFFQFLYPIHSFFVQGYLKDSYKKWVNNIIPHTGVDKRMLFWSQGGVKSCNGRLVCGKVKINTLSVLPLDVHLFY